MPVIIAPWWHSDQAESYCNMVHIVLATCSVSLFASIRNVFAVTQGPYCNQLKCFFLLCLSNNLYQNLCYSHAWMSREIWDSHVLSNPFAPGCHLNSLRCFIPVPFDICSNILHGCSADLVLTSSILDCSLSMHCRCQEQSRSLMSCVGSIESPVRPLSHTADNLCQQGSLTPLCEDIQIEASHASNMKAFNVVGDLASRV